MTTEIEAPDAAALRASVLLGQTQGAMVLVGAGLGWVMFGLSALGALPLGLFLAVLAVPALLLLGALAVRRSVPGVPDAEWSPEMSRVFRQAVAGEGVGILAILVVTLPLRRPEWILPLVALAVGLHFLPLARVFQRPLYYLTGAALCLLCLVTFAVPPHLGVPHLQGWRLVAGLGAGVVLWVSALMMLIQSWIGLRSFSQARRLATGADLQRWFRVRASSPTGIILDAVSRLILPCNPRRPHETLMFTGIREPEDPKG